MDSRLTPDDAGARLSESPRRSPQITHGLTSPVRSVHPEMHAMESIHSQADFGHRTADFFDDTSEDDVGETVETQKTATASNRNFSAARQKHNDDTLTPLPTNKARRQSTKPQSDAYLRLNGDDPHVPAQPFVDSPGTSFNGSVDELLPDEHASSPPELPRAAHLVDSRASRTPAAFNRSDDDRVPQYSSKVDQILGAHAIAHEITLQALMRDEMARDRSLQSFAPIQTGDRRSILAANVSFDDPRSPRNRIFSKPPVARKVHVVPPPIDTSAPRRSIPNDIVRTPYPLVKPNLKDFAQSPMPPSAGTASTSGEGILTLSIRRCNPNSRSRVSTFEVPNSNDFTAVKSSSDGEKERYFRGLDFDDALFFRKLERSYRELIGPWRLFSARSLSRIVVSGTATRSADAAYGWLPVPRNPRQLASKDLSDTCREEKLMRHFRRPAIGKARYAWVHWAHGLAAAPPVTTLQPELSPEIRASPDLLPREDQPEGLEFIVGWSWRRILGALALVLMVSVAAALLWIFLGRNTITGVVTGGGFRDAGDRVIAGVVMGICILLLGLTGIAGWIGVSWLIM